MSCSPAERNHKPRPWVNDVRSQDCHIKGIHLKATHEDYNLDSQKAMICGQVMGLGIGSADTMRPTAMLT